MMRIKTIHFYTVLFLLVGLGLSAEPQDKSACEKILCKNTLAPSSIIPAFLKGDGFMKIISDLNDIRQEYLKYSTAETEFRKEKIKTVVDQLNLQEEQVSVFFCGSMQFGQTEKKSDLEAIFIAQTLRTMNSFLKNSKVP